MPHLKPLENSEISDTSILERFKHYEETRGFTPNSIRTMARRPNIVKAFMDMNQAVLYEGTVATELKMLVSLASSFASGCRYCQSHMANLSDIYAAPQEKIDDILSYETSVHYSDAERAAIALAFNASQLPNNASKADFDRLKLHFNENQIVEIVATIALFGYLNRWNDTMATSLEPLANERAKQLLKDHNWSAGKHEGPA